MGTTLLNLLGGLDRPSQGAIEVTGARIDATSGARLARWRAERVELLRALNRDHGKTIVMVTHDPRAAAARRVLHLDKGRLIGDAAA